MKINFLQFFYLTIKFILFKYEIKWIFNVEEVFHDFESFTIVNGVENQKYNDELFSGVFIFLMAIT